MPDLQLPEDLQRAIAFHGHLCPGLLIGYRAAKAARTALGLTTPSQDEELVAEVENNSCSVDAFQVLLSTTFGKGNLKWLDHGKQVFTVTDRLNNRAVRVAFIGDRLKVKRPDGSVDRDKFIETLLTAPDQDLLKVQEILPSPPEEARIEPSLTCAVCGESVQASRAVTLDSRTLCRPCAARQAK